MAVKIAYGKRDGKLVHISAISEAERGDKCNCVCPKCGDSLCARMGEQNAHHFAHTINTDCNPLHVNQTSLHIIAKEIVKNNSEILFPGWKIEFDEIKNEWASEVYEREFQISLPDFKNISIKYTDAVTEINENGIRADIKVKANNKPCYIEILVTHPVDDEKRKKVEAYGISMFEINVSSLVNEIDSESDAEKLFEKISNGVLSECPRYWIFNKEREDKKAEKIAEYQRKYDNAKRKHLEHTAAVISELHRDFEPGNYKKELLRLHDDEKAMAFYNKTFDVGWRAKAQSFPYYMDIPITGEFVIGCDRRIWQACIFHQYVFHATEKFCCKDIIKAISEGVFAHEGIVLNKNKIYEGLVSVEGIEKPLHLPDDVINKYLSYLHFVSFITFNSNNGLYKSYGRKTPIPPYNKNSNLLENTIKKTNGYAPNINSLIYYALRRELPQNQQSLIKALDDYK